MRTTRISSPAIGAAFVLCLLSGCAGSKSGTNSASDGRLGDAPITVNTRFAAGQVAEAQNNPNLAIQQYQQALQIDPEHKATLYRLGVIYAELKQYPQAIDAWQRYLKATGNSATAYADLAFCYELSGDIDKAETAYQSGLAKDPKCAPCRVNYGLLLARRGRVNEAITQWQSVLTEAEIHYNLGGVYSLAGRNEQAKIEYKKALELDPTLSDAQQKVTALDRN